MSKMSGRNRRDFMMNAVGVVTALPLTSAPFLAEAMSTGKRGPGPSRLAPSKIDITLYDRPGWTSHAWYHTRRKEGSIIVPIQGSDMRAPFGDFLRTITDDLVLKSTDGGKTWTIFRDPGLTAYPWGCYGLPGKTRDRKLVSVICASYVLSPEERQEHLKKLEIERFYNPKSEWEYTPWPASMADELRRKGIYVFGPSEEGGNELVFSLTGFVCRISTDDGKTWTTRPIKGIPFMSDEAGSFRETLVTRKGTWVASIFGTPNPERKPVSKAEFTSPQMPVGSFVLRSEDQGNMWTPSQIAYDPSGDHSFDETSLLELPSGRILAMLRHTDWTNRESSERYLYQSYSDDEGKTWSTPVNSGLRGYPAHLLQLRSGKILCTYGYRFDPWGCRAALSSDGGKTWDLQHSKILRDDSLPGWTTYPMSSQLDDGTIFTTYGLLKNGTPAKMPRAGKLFGDGKKGRYVYAAASLYTEDYVKPMGR